MKYKVKKLDKRFHFNNLYEYSINFPNRMIGTDIDIVWFNQVLQWCNQTWGWSAEINQIGEIRNYIIKKSSVNHNTNFELPPECNNFWSWSNKFDTLRIYLATEKELSMFFLVHANR